MDLSSIIVSLICAVMIMMSYVKEIISPVKNQVGFYFPIYVFSFCIVLSILLSLLANGEGSSSEDSSKTIGYVKATIID